MTAQRASRLQKKWTTELCMRSQVKSRWNGRVFCTTIIIMIPKLGFPKLLPRSLPLFSSKKPQLDHYDPFPLEHYDVGQRLDRYLKNTAVGWISAQKYLRAGDIFVLTAGGEAVFENNHRIAEGDRLMVRRGKEIEQQLIGKKNAEYIQMDPQKVEQKVGEMTVFDNQNITVLNKLAGYSVQGDADPNRNLFSLMASRFKKDMIYISHRLDKPTTGLVFISKNLPTAQLLGQALESREGMEKYYIALTEGRQIAEKVGTLACQMEWTSKHKARVTEFLTKEGDSQQAVTNYLVMKEQQLSDISWRNLVGMRLVTGRKHQIRCQLAQQLINPVINDELYLGRRESEAAHAIYLHSFALKVTSQTLLQRVFKISSQSQGYENEKGSIRMVDGEMHIYAKLPPHWHRYSQTINNHQLPTALKAISQKQVYPKPPRVTSLK